MSNIRKRGVRSFVDTTTIAEFDIRIAGLSDTQVEIVINQLKDMPFSESDLVCRPIRLRRINDEIVFYAVSRERGDCVVTVFGMEKNASDDMAETAETLMARINELMAACLFMAKSYNVQMIDFDQYNTLTNTEKCAARLQSLNCVTEFDCCEPSITIELSDMQRDILVGNVDGKSIKEMSENLGVAPVTVEKHLQLAREELLAR